MIRYDYSEWRYLVWYKKRNLSVNYAYAEDNDEVKHYDLYASEPSEAKIYYTKISSDVNPEFVTDFEENWKDRCNLPTERLGMTPSEINKMLQSQQLMIRELRMINKHLANISGLRYTFADLDSEANKDHFV